MLTGYLIIESVFFLLSFSALPVTVLYYLRSRESWIPPYLGIQLTAGAYVLVDIMYNGALFRVIRDVPETHVLFGITILRAALLFFVPLFIHRLFDLSEKGRRYLFFFPAGAILGAWTLFSFIGGAEISHLSPVYLAGAGFSTALAGYVLVMALCMHRKMKPPMKSTNRLFLVAGPIYIIYLAVYTLFPITSGRVFRPVPLSFTNLAYGIWNMVFLWFLIRFMMEKKPSSDDPIDINIFLDTYEFTEREREIQTLVVQGLGNKQIAAELDINENTVKSHLYNAYAKIGIHTRVELIKAVYSVVGQYVD